MKNIQNGETMEVVTTNNGITLETYTKQLNDIQKDIVTNDTLCITHGKITLELAIQAGTILNTIKKSDLVIYGQWANWVKDQLPSIGQDTEYRYRTLATAHENKKLPDNCSGLREAYIHIGLIKKGVNTPKKTKTDTTKTGNTITGGTKQGTTTTGNIEKVASTTGPVIPGKTVDQYKMEFVKELAGHIAEWNTLPEWIANHTCPVMTVKEEVIIKARMVLDEIKKTRLPVMDLGTRTTRKPKNSVELPVVEMEPV